MGTGFIRAALLALLLAGQAAQPGAQPGEPMDDFGDAGDEDSEETGMPSGPVVRRPPPSPDLPMPDALPAEQADEPEADAGPVLEVLDDSVFDGVFAPYTVRDGRAIPESLTGEPGDPVRGRRLYHNFGRTGCSLCHGTAEAPRRADSTRTAPPLDRVSDRLTPARIRLWIVAPETIRPDTEMPAFHKPGQRTDVTDPLYGGPRLTAAEVEDLVAYLTQQSLGEVQ